MKVLLIFEVLDNLIIAIKIFIWRELFPIILVTLPLEATYQ
jgi:hypothetical protein